MGGPTREELANMSWQAIAGGANGLVYYAYHHIVEPRATKNNDDEFTWGDMCAIARDIKKYEDVLLAKPGIAVKGATDELAVRTWRKDGCDYMLIVNCTVARQQATLRLPRKIGDMSVDLGPAPKVNGDRLEVDFSPMAYTMLRLK